MPPSAFISVDRRLRFLSVLLPLALAIGCVEPKGGGGPIGGEVSLDGAWEAAPVAMRIYPSTRFVREKGVPMLEARIELFDEMGDSIKSSGHVRFELFAAGDAPGIDTGQMLYSWDIPLVDLEDQRQYYDPITRGYLLRLETRSTAVAEQQVLLRAMFQPPEGERLTDEQPVRARW